MAPDPSDTPAQDPSAEPAPEPSTDALTRPSVDPTWWATNWKKFCLTVAVFTTFASLSCFGGGLIGSTVSTKRSAQYQQSKAMVENDAEIAAYTGTPVRESWIAWATVDTDDQGFARRTILFTLTGPAGEVTVESIGTDRTPDDGLGEYPIDKVRVYLPQSAPAVAGQVITLTP
ncbi:MAG: hypothetical protein AAGI54_10170 [Planctomycetota bacterium]